MKSVTTMEPILISSGQFLQVEERDKNFKIFEVKLANALKSLKSFWGCR